MELVGGIFSTNKNRGVFFQRIKIEKRNKNKIEDKIIFERHKTVDYHLELSNKFAILQGQEEETDNIDNNEERVKELWLGFKRLVKEAAKEVFTQKKNPKKPWFNDEYKALVQKRRELKKRMLADPIVENKEAYQSIPEKTHYLKVSRRPEQDRAYLEILNYKFRVTKEFKYLGIVITHDNREEVAIQYRLAAADRQ